MNKIKDADFMTKFPPALKKDKSMLALGQLIAEELHITAHETKKKYYIRQHRRVIGNMA